MLQRSAVLGGLILLLGGALGVTLAIRLGRPLQRLRIVAEAMAAGDLQLRAHVARSDEIGELGRAFDHMAERLQSSVRRAKEGDARARPITDSVADGILTITRTGSWSPAIRPRSTSFACKSIELAGRPVAQPLPDERSDRSGRPSVLRIAGGAAGTGGTGGTRREVQGRRPDGSLLPLELTVSETKVDGLQCTIAVVRDITERMFSNANYSGWRSAIR